MRTQFALLLTASLMLFAPKAFCANDVDSKVKTILTNVVSAMSEVPECAKLVPATVDYLKRHRTVSGVTLLAAKANASEKDDDKWAQKVTDAIASVVDRTSVESVFLSAIFIDIQRHRTELIDLAEKANAGEPKLWSKYHADITSMTTHYLAEISKPGSTATAADKASVKAVLDWWMAANATGELAPEFYTALASTTWLYGTLGKFETTYSLVLNYYAGLSHGPGRTLPTLLDGIVSHSARHYRQLDSDAILYPPDDTRWSLFYDTLIQMMQEKTAGDMVHYCKGHKPDVEKRCLEAVGVIETAVGQLAALSVADRNTRLCALVNNEVPLPAAEGPHHGARLAMAFFDSISPGFLEKNKTNDYIVFLSMTVSQDYFHRHEDLLGGLCQ